MHRFALLLALVLVLPGIATAQRSNTEGLRLHFQLNATAIDANEEGSGTDNGGGAGLGIGYGFSRLFTLYLDVDGSLMNAEALDEYALAHADLGARFHFGPPRRPTIPYLNAALTGWALGYETRVGTFSASGSGVTLGGGLLVFLSRVVAIDLGLGVTFGSFTSIKLGGISIDTDEEATSARLGIGLTYFRGR